MTAKLSTRKLTDLKAKAANLGKSRYAVGYIKGLATRVMLDEDMMLAADKILHGTNMDAAGRFGLGYRDGFAGKEPVLMPHGGMGNTLAQKGPERASEQFLMRMRPSQRQQYEAAAKQLGIKLTAFLLMAGDELANKTLTDTRHKESGHE